MATPGLNMIIRLIVQSGGAVSGIRDLRRAFAELAGTIAGFQFVEEFVKANREIEKLVRGLNAISGNQGIETFDLLAESANRLGISLADVSHSFLELNAATKDTEFEGNKTRQLFEALGQALSVTGADAVRFNRGFRAIGQILSKDQLFAEELRQQLSEALPGSIQDFSRALNITPGQLFKFMQDGAIAGDELRRTLVLVTKEWKKTYPVLEKQKFTVDQKLALIKNQIQLLFKEVGDTGVWQAFSSSLLTAADLLESLRNNLGGFAATVKATYRTVAQEVNRVKDQISSESVTIDFSNVEFSPAGLIRNFRAVFDLLPAEARIAMQPVRDAIADIDFSKIAVGAVSGFELVGKLIGINVANYVENAKILIDELELKWVEFQRSIVGSKFTVRSFQLFGRGDELNNLFKRIEGLDDRYSSLKQKIDDARASSNERLDSSVTGALEDAASAFDRLASNRGLERQAILLEEASKRERQRAFFQKEYIQNLNTEASAKTRSLNISKEQSSVEKQLLKLKQEYQNAEEEASAAQYRRWAENKQITQEGADFLIRSAKDESLRKAWNAAQDAVKKYNTALELSKGDNEETLGFLRDQANEQLRFANSKARETNDAYRLKQIYEAQVALLESRAKASKDFKKVLDEAESETKVKPSVTEDSVKELMEDLQIKVDSLPPLSLKVAPAVDGLDWDAAEVEEALSQSIKSGEAMAGVGDAATEAMRRAAAATGTYGTQLETLKRKAEEFKARLAELQDKKNQPTSSELEPKTLFNVPADFTKNLNQPFEQANRSAQELRDTLRQASQQRIQNELGAQLKEATDSAKRFKDTLFQVLIKPTVDQSALQEQRKKLANETQPIALPAGVFIQKGSVERAKTEFLSLLPDVQWKIETIVDRDEITGAQRDIQRLTAQDSRIEITPRTELLDAKLRDIGSQFQQFNRTAGAGITQGFENAALKAGQFVNIVDQVNLKMRATQAVAGMAAEEIDKALADRKAIETQVKFNRTQADKEAKAFQDETKRLFERSQEQPELQIRVAPEAYARIGEIQAELKQLQDSGATNIEVTVDEKTGKLIVTADTSQADASVSETIAKINASRAVLTVQVRYNDPGFTPRNTSVNVQKRRWGGHISGYGGGDRVRALLEPGEFVLRKEAVRSIGLDKLFEMNRKKRLPRAPRVRDSVSVPRFASGGPVESQPIVINVPGRQPIRVSGSRDQAEALANLLTSVGRAL